MSEGADPGRRRSPPDPDLSVVIGSAGPQDALRACLSTLEPQTDGVEVLVCESGPSSPSLRSHFPWVHFHTHPGELVPGLWREGIDRSRGRTVALTIATMVPAPDWVAEIRSLRRHHDVVAGAIEPDEDLRLSDWAEYFSRYSRDMLPFEGHENRQIPGDNCAYARELLEATVDLYRDGFWEPVVNRRLAAEGTVLWHAPEMVVRHGRSAGARAFARQRLAHGRAHGSQRGVVFGRGRNLIAVIASPAVPLVLTARILREVFAKRRNRLAVLAALPLILAFSSAWALGEARGHLDALH